MCLDSRLRGNDTAELILLRALSFGPVDSFSFGLSVAVKEAIDRATESEEVKELFELAQQELVSHFRHAQRSRDSMGASPVVDQNRKDSVLQSIS